MTAPVIKRLKTWDRRGTNVNGASYVYEAYVGNRTVQGKPYNLPTQNKISHRKVNRGTDPSSSLNGGPNYYSVNGLHSPVADTWKVYRDYAYHKAYMDFLDSVRGERSQLLELMAEARKTAETINNRCEYLLRFTERLVAITKMPRRRARKALAILNRRLPKKPKKRRIRKLLKDPAALFIEYRWVYATAAADIYNSATFLDRFEPSVDCKGRSGRREYRIQKTNGSGLYPTVETIQHSYRCVAKVQSLAAVTNPNLYLMSQLGLTNPVSTAYNLVKFSWLVDWFSTLGDWLSSWDALFGISLTNPNHMWFASCKTQRSKKEWAGAPHRKYMYYAMSGEWIDLTREVGLGPGPKVMVRPVGRISLTRGATAVALLIGYLR